MRIAAIWTLAAATCVAGPALADVWDVQQDNDNGLGTDNELVHGSQQDHDLGVLTGNVADEDWYIVGQKPRSSYEVVVDGTSGDISSGKGPGLVRMASDGSTVLQSSVGLSAGLDYSRSLRWEQTSATPVNDQYIRVFSGGCTTNCGPDDVYRIRFYETTGAIPRFNNAGSQVSVLLIQNPTDYAVAGTAYFWNVAGSALHVQPFTIPAHGLYSVTLTTIAPLVGQLGTITVSHNARYGDLAGKAVALEPSTGFSFDTPMVIRPR